MQIFIHEFSIFYIGTLWFYLFREGRQTLLYLSLIILDNNRRCFCCGLEARIADDRKAVQQADRTGLPITSDVRPGSHTQILSSEFIAEALTISDLFDLNEVASVELLLAGYRHAIS